MAGGAGNKKPTAVASRGFLSKAFSTSTSANGVASYDDYQNYLSNFSIHYERKIEILSGGVKLSIRRAADSRRQQQVWSELSPLDLVKLDYLA